MEGNQMKNDGAQPLELLVAMDAVARCEKLESDFRNKGDYCHNNIGSKTSDDWEQMDKFLVAAAYDIRKILHDVKNLAAFYARHATTEGNQMKMREALKKLLDAIKSLSRTHNDDLPEDVRAILGRMAFEANEALAVPMRNCDVGTAEEQMKRQHDTMYNTTSACPDSDWACKKCFAEWAQMPY